MSIGEEFTVIAKKCAEINERIINGGSPMFYYLTSCRRTYALVWATQSWNSLTAAEQITLIHSGNIFWTKEEVEAAKARVLAKN